ncbi:MAG: hypothetical protein AVDCRST_MAG55-1619, partial [uncultured Rubrobacteraceae bacterium]
ERLWADPETRRGMLGGEGCPIGDRFEGGPRRARAPGTRSAGARAVPGFRRRAPRGAGRCV